jgi:hypothetical protein
MESEGPTARTETLDPLEFLSRMVTHIPDRRHVMTRYYKMVRQPAIVPCRLSSARPPQLAAFTSNPIYLSIGALLSGNGNSVTQITECVHFQRRTP